MSRERNAHHGHANESIDAKSFTEAASTTRLREKFLTRYQVYKWETGHPYSRR